MTVDAAAPPGAGHRPGDAWRLLGAVLLPLAAFALQWFFWEGIRPLAWLLFYPAVFASAWLAGLWGGLTATAIAALLGWWFFIPTIYSLSSQQPATLIGIGIFIIMGMLFSLAHDRLRRITRQKEAALASVSSANALLEGRIAERTGELTRTIEAQRESEERLRLLGDNLPDSYVYQYCFEPDGTPRFLYLSSGVESVHGVSRQDALADAAVLRRQIDPAQFPVLAAAETASRQQLSDLSMELQVRRVDGRRRWVKWRARPRRKADGQVFWDGVATDITARKTAEAALRESEVQYRHTLDGMLEGCQIIGFDWRYRYLNDAAEQHNRRPKGELLGRVMQECWPGITETPLFPLLRSCMAERATHALSNEFRFSDGRTGWFRFTIQPSAEGIVIFSEDITERVRMEKVLRESREQLQRFIEQAPAALAMFDTEMRYLCVSRRWRTDYQLGERELIGESHYRVFPEIGAALREAHRRGLAGEVLRNEGQSFERADGSVQWLRWELRPWYDAAGSIGGIVIFSEDITEQKRAEEEIVRLNLQLHQLISAIKELASVHTLDSVHHIVTTAARMLNGADGATMVCREGEFCRYVDEDAIGPLWKGKSFPLSACLSGWVMLNRRPAVIPDIAADERVPAGEYATTFVRSLVMVPVNISEPVAAIGNYWEKPHQPAEMEVRLLQTLADAAARAIENVRLLGELEERVRQRTSQLEAANRELEAFSYSVSHDLKAPLRGIDGYSQLLDQGFRDRLDPEGQQFLRNIRACTAQMHELIEDLLSYAHLERRPLQSTAIDLAALVQTVVAERAMEIEQGGVELSLGLPALRVRGDRDGLAAALRNLLGNALKFSRKARPPAVAIGARVEGDRVLLWVRDNGIGFDMKFHERIFDIFQRLQRVEDYPGTGIGLALVRKSMERMGGRVWAESAPGKGATFFLELPT